MHVLLTYFGNNLPEDQKLNLDRREEVLRKGIEAIQGIEGVHIGNQLRMACFAQIEIMTDEAKEKCMAILSALEPKVEVVEEKGQKPFHAATDSIKVYSRDAEDVLLASAKDPMLEMPETMETW